MKTISYKLYKEKDKSLQDRLDHLFRTGFTAIDLAEPLLFFDGDKSTEEVLAILNKNKVNVAGIYEKSAFSGIIIKGQCAKGRCRDFAQAIKPECILNYSAQYQEVISVLSKFEFCFITFLGKISGVILRKDMNKPSVRMWLFGLITLVEMLLSGMLDFYYPEDSWINELPDGRLDKARFLQSERKRKGQDLELKDCLYFIDKASILTKNPSVREELGFNNRKESKEMVIKLESLRNSLAHTHDIITHDWEAIVDISRSMDRMLTRF